MLLIGWKRARIKQLPTISNNLPCTGRATPRNTTVELTHIEVPANMNAWPSFHNGVAAGLKLVPYDAASSIASAWITFNCPKSNNPTNEHAGKFLNLIFLYPLLICLCVHLSFYLPCLPYFYVGILSFCLSISVPSIHRQF